MELYYKPLDNKNNDPMGNTQLSGFCFEQKSGTNTVEFWTRVGGTYVKPAAQVTQGAWNHLVGTFDGSSVKLYLNGELQDTKSASGSITVPPLYMFLGGDTTSNGNLEYAANCEIALARVYTGAMNAEDVQKAYEEATQPDDVQPGEVNTYLLEKTVEYAQSLVDSGDTNGVTDAAKAAFDKALSDAKAVLEKANPSQAEVDAAVEALASAMNGLTAETTPQPTQTPEASQTPEATQKPVVSEKPETNVPQTGDASQLAAMVGVLMSSATALGGVAIARKRRNG